MPLKNDKSIDDMFDHFEVFPWNKNLETGEEQIDAQHKALIELLNRLARTLVYNEEMELNTAFDELAHYADFHFSQEEAIWAEHFKDDYWFTSHQMSHASFLPTVMELKNKDKNAELTDIIESIVKFLIRWLAFHIIDNDKRMSIAMAVLKTGGSLEEAKASADKQMSGTMRSLIETILYMYDGLSSNTIELMRERYARIKAEEKLRRANKRLEELSITDHLTGLHNRRHFAAVFQQELKRAKREKKALTYIHIDIDFFKLFNDTYGHPEGDKALVKVGKALREICRRPTDFAFRVGGEEFSILLTDLPPDKALDFGEKVRSSIEDLKIPHSRNKGCSCLTISAGLINRIPSQSTDQEDFIQEADKRLYQAKAAGRNRVVGPRD